MLPTKGWRFGNVRLTRENVMKRSMPTNEAAINQSTPDGGQEPTNIQRRTVIGGALAALLSFPGRMMAQGTAVPDDSFVLLLKGLYQPVVNAPNLGLSMVDLNDGSYSTTKIYRVSGIPGNKNENKAVGNFYVQFDGDLCAYHVPGGSFAMRFTGSDVSVCSRRGRWAVLGRNLRPDGTGGDRDLSIFCRWSKPHGG